MERADYPTQKRVLTDPDPDPDPAPALDPDIFAMTPAQRMALCYESTRRLLAMQGINLDEQRLQRHVARVVRDGGS